MPRGCWPERYIPLPRAKPGCYWLLRDTGTPSRQLHGGREFPDTVSASVPFSPWHQSQSGGEGGRLRTVSWGAESGEGLRGQRPGAGKGVKGEGQPGPGRPLPTSDPILPPLGEHWPPSKASAALSRDVRKGVRAMGWGVFLICLWSSLDYEHLPETQSPQQG